DGRGRGGASRRGGSCSPTAARPSSSRPCYEQPGPCTAGGPLAVPGGAEVNGTVRGPAAAARPRAAAGHLVTGVVLPVVTAAVALAGLRVPVPGGVSVLDGVAVGVVLVWSLAGAVCARVPGRAPQWPMAAGTLAAAVALTAAR